MSSACPASDTAITHELISRKHVARCVLQWELSGAGAGEASGGGLQDDAEAVAEEESDGYVLDLKDGSDLDRGSDFEAAAEERRRAPVRKTTGAGTGSEKYRSCETPPPPPSY